DPEERCEVDLEQLAEDGFRRPLDRPLEEDAGVRDEDVESAVAELEGALDCPVRRVPVAVVALDERRAGRVRHRPTALAAPAGEGDGHSLVAKACDACLADARRSPGHERDPTLEAEPPRHAPSAAAGFATAPARSDARMPPSRSRIEPLQNAPSGEAK